MSDRSYHPWLYLIEDFFNISLQTAFDTGGNSVSCCRIAYERLDVEIYEKMEIYDFDPYFWKIITFLKKKE